MSKEYAILPTIPLDAGSSYTHPHELPELVHMDNPASDVMTDLSYVKSAAIQPDAPISQALIEMKVSGEHLLLVIDEQERVIGLITSEDILGERTMKLIVEKRIPRADVKVRMVMIPQESIPVFNQDDLRHAKVGNIIKTLHDLNQHDALVVNFDAEGDKQTVIGLFSLSNISKQLGKDMTTDLSSASSIAELQHGLK